MLKKPAVKRYYVENYPYFVTTATYKKRPIFADKKKSDILKNVIYNLRGQNRFSLLSFCIMPDHLHLLLIPGKEQNISTIMQSIKRGSSRIINQKFNSKGKIWEPRFFDTVPRDEKELLNEIEYIHSNPVKAKLVEAPEEYLFSTANPKFENDLEKYFSGD